MKMKMAFLSLHSSPAGRAGSKDTGGMSTLLRGLSGALGAAGHQVDLFTLAGGAGQERVRYIAPRVRLIHPAHDLGPLDKSTIYPRRVAIAEGIDRFTRRENSGYDLIFSHYWLSGACGSILKKRWAVPHLLMFHTLGRAKNEACPGENEPAVRLRTEAELARSCDLLVAAAEQEKARLLAYYDLVPEKVALIPCGLDRGLFYPAGKSGRLEAKNELAGPGAKKIILAVGRIEPVKGLETVLAAAALLKTGDDFEVIIAGGPGGSAALTERLKRAAGSEDLCGKVRFAGVVEHQNLPLYYRAADVTVLASHYESFGLVALESIACGTPVVAAPVGVVPELIPTGETGSPLGCLVTGRDPARWAAAIDRVLARNEPISPGTVEAALAPYRWSDAATALEAALQAR